jgi:lipoprotein-releasing system permease protein
LSVLLKIAFRYIFPRGNINFITIISFISIIGIAVGVAALIVVLSIFNGFRSISEDAILDIDPAIRITSHTGAYIDNWQEVADKIKENATACLQTKAVLINRDKIEVVELIATLDNTFPLEEHKCIGKPSIADNDIVLGIALADRLKVTIYDTLKLLSTKMLEYSFHTLQIPQAINVRPTGLFQCNIKEYDLTNCYANCNIVRQISNAPLNACSYIDVIAGKEDIEATSQNIASIIGQNYDVQTWKDLNRDLYNVMQMERVAVFCVLGLILLIAVFNVLASLAMTVTEKKSEIAILKAIGGSNRFISRIYIVEGIGIGLIGTALGFIIGIALIYGQIRYEWLLLDGSAYITNVLPVILNWSEVGIVCLFSLSLSAIATIFPATRATKLQVAQAISTE